MSADLEAIGLAYAAAWSSHDPARVASFFAFDGSLQVNDAATAVGRPALEAVARGFFTELPDIVVIMDGIHRDGERVIFRWTLTATSPGGNPIRVSGQENWRVDDDGLIAESLGSFDAAEYARQLHG